MTRYPFVLFLLLLVACADPVEDDKNLDGDCLLMTLEVDYYADGTVDSRTTYTYDENGNMLTEEEDSGADGTVDSRITYTYDDNGKMQK